MDRYARFLIKLLYCKIDIFVYYCIYSLLNSVTIIVQAYCACSTEIDTVEMGM